MLSLINNMSLIGNCDGNSFSQNKNIWCGAGAGTPHGGDHLEGRVSEYY